MIVADTNLIAYFLIDGEFTEAAEAVYDADPDWIAPYLWRSEFRNILALYLRQNLIFLSEAQEIMNQAELLLLDKESEVNSNVVLKLAHDSGLSAYDCEYIALAQDLNLNLVTSDRKILKAFPKIAFSISDFPTIV